MSKSRDPLDTIPLEPEALERLRDLSVPSHGSPRPPLPSVPFELTREEPLPLKAEEPLPLAPRAPAGRRPEASAPSIVISEGEGDDRASVSVSVPAPTAQRIGIFIVLAVLFVAVGTLCLDASGIVDLRALRARLSEGR